MHYEMTTLRLEKCEFEKLVFMNAPDAWTCNEKEYDFLLSLCTRPLREVVEKVRDKSKYKGNPDPTKVFENIEGDARHWFQRHARISECFDSGLMGELWIRNLSEYPCGEREKCPQGSFYLEDGNHRALVYAMAMELGQTNYRPIKAIHANSWELASGILGFLPESAKALEHNGELQTPKQLQKVCQLPIGLEIKTYKR